MAIGENFLQKQVGVCYRWKNFFENSWKVKIFFENRVEESTIKKSLNNVILFSSN